MIRLGGYMSNITRSGAVLSFVRPDRPDRKNRPHWKAFTLGGALLLGLWCAGPAEATTCTPPANGTTADATQITNCYAPLASPSFTGSLTVGPSTATALIGNALVGYQLYGSTDYSVFANNDAFSASTNNYSVRQNTAGETLIGSSSGHPLIFRIGNVANSGIDLFSDGKVSIGSETEITTPATPGLVISNATGEILNLNDTSASGSPFVEWDQAGTRRALIQYLSTIPEFKILAAGTASIAFWTNSAEQATLTGTGNFGIGTTSPAQKLEVNGQVKIDTLAAGSATTLCINASVVSSCSSSLRYKDNVADARFGLAEIEKMRPVTFDWKSSHERDIGFIAEEMAAVNPLFATYRDGKVEGVKYGQLTAVLVNAVKQLSAENKDLRKTLAGQDVRINRLEAILKGTAMPADVQSASPNRNRVRALKTAAVSRQ